MEKTYDPEHDEGLNHDMRRAWYPVAMSSEILPGKSGVAPFKAHLLGDPTILFRDSMGKPHCLSDKCSHRSAPLSVGTIVNGTVECKYHGWQFNGEGACVHIPALLNTKKIPKLASVDVYPSVERYGYIWVWPVPNSSPDPQSIDHEEEMYSSNADKCRSGWVYYEIAKDLDISHELLVENLLDPAHVPFTHVGTIGQRSDACALDMTVATKNGFLLGSVVEDGASEKTKKLPDMVFKFKPPCCAILDLKMPGIGRAYHVTYCVPTRPGEVRAMLRIYYDFMSWVSYLPGLTSFLRRLMTKIVYQDYELLHAQDSNIALGANPWNLPIRVDGLPVRYRQWFRKAMKMKPWFKGFSGDIEDLETCTRFTNASCSTLSKQVANEAQEYGFGHGFNPKSKTSTTYAYTALAFAALAVSFSFVMLRR